MTKEQIVEETLNLFLKYGVKSISMDDISNSIGISKKTLYQLFNNKEYLVESTIKEFINVQDVEIRNLLNEDIDVIDKILKIYSIVLYHFKSSYPTFIHGLEKYFPKTFNLFIDFKKELFHVNITHLLKQGKNEGIFRKDIDDKLINELHISRLKTIIYGSLLSDRSASDPMYFEILIILLRGITTEKGYKILDEKLSSKSIYK